MGPNPRLIILSLMLGIEARGDTELGVRELLAAAALFALPENAVRVALARAVSAGLLVAPRRGSYALGPQARPLAQEVSRWRQAPQWMVQWTGDWIAVHVGATGRSDRAALRARERAFNLLGLAEFERGLHLRPNNLVGGAQAQRARLHALVPDGVDAGTLFVLRELDPVDAERAHCLWQPANLDATYRETSARLDAWLRHAHALPLDQAARECFELGHDAIRQLVYDPLLPAPLVDADARSAFFAAVSRFDDAGKAIWQRFLCAARAQSPPARPVSLPLSTLEETAS